MLTAMGHSMEMRKEKGKDMASDESRDRKEWEQLKEDNDVNY